MFVQPFNTIKEIVDAIKLETDTDSRENIKIADWESLDPHTKMSEILKDGTVLYIFAYSEAAENTEPYENEPDMMDTLNILIKYKNTQLTLPMNHQNTLSELKETINNRANQDNPKQIEIGMLDQNGIINRIGYSNKKKLGDIPDLYDNVVLYARDLRIAHAKFQYNIEIHDTIVYCENTNIENPKGITLAKIKDCTTPPFNSQTHKYDFEIHDEFVTYDMNRNARDHNVICMCTSHTKGQNCNLNYRPLTFRRRR